MAFARLHLSGCLLGFALGGFFDGILLHQILRWHHLLSLVPGVGDITRQVLFDGLFHALMYLIAVAGLIMLWRSRSLLPQPDAGRRLLAAILIGFGCWHILDGAASHWILGIHRIKLDSPNPLAWDLLWFFAFGLLPLLAGWFLRRGGPNVSARAAAAGAVLVLLAGGAWAARAPDDVRSAIVLFRPGMTQAQAVNAVARSGGFVLWHSRGVWAVGWPDRPKVGRLYGSGAILVSSSLGGVGCLAWSRA